MGQVKNFGGLWCFGKFGVAQYVCKYRFAYQNK